MLMRITESNWDFVYEHRYKFTYYSPIKRFLSAYNKHKETITKYGPLIGYYVNLENSTRLKQIFSGEIKNGTK